MAVQIQFRRDTTANWNSINPILAQGEVGYDLDVHKLKVGDGVNYWTGLTYSQGTDGTSGINGGTGSSGTSGIDGSSGSSGLNATGQTYTEFYYDNTSRTLYVPFVSLSGGTVSGTSGTSGINGTSGTNGSNGTNGTSGTDGIGSNGTSGTSGTNGGGGSISATNKAVLFNDNGAISGTSLLTFDPATSLFTWCSGLTSSNNVKTSGFRLERAGEPPFTGGAGFGITFGNRTGTIGVNSLACSTEQEVGAVTWKSEATAENAFAWGRQCKSTGNFTVSFGDITTASAEGSMAIGQSTTASGERSFAQGVGSGASGTQAVALNASYATGSLATSLGTSTASGYKSLAQGWTTAQGIYQTTVGFRNIATGNTSASDSPTDLNTPYFIVGAGSGTTYNYNAMEVSHNFTKIFNVIALKDVVSGSMYGLVMSGGTLTTYAL